MRLLSFAYNAAPWACLYLLFPSMRVLSFLHRAAPWVCLVAMFAVVVFVETRIPRKMQTFHIPQDPPSVTEQILALPDADLVRIHDKLYAAHWRRARDVDGYPIPPV